MQFPNPQSWKEQDVREIIIRPLLEKLGYKKDSKNDVLTEYRLNHPYAKFGRKEIPVKAFSDYILDVEGIKWVLEAKPPVPITDDDVDQSFSYAAHYEVRGLFFAICNGLELRIYITQNYRRGVVPDRLFTFDEIYREIEGTVNQIAFVLAPESIRREYPRPPIIEEMLPLSTNLRSSARMRNGQIVITKTHPLMRALENIITTILTGSVIRNDKGKIVAELESCVPNAKLQELNRQLGLHRMVLTADIAQLSVDEKFPTVFTSQQEVFFPSDTMLMSLDATPYRVPIDMNMKVDTTALGTLVGSYFQGTFETSYLVVNNPILQAALGGKALDIGGTFRVELE
ncbi:MAG TPA: hypothetical protein VGA01_05935 [Candidatus Binatia bacterium]